MKLFTMQFTCALLSISPSKVETLSSAIHSQTLKNFRTFVNINDALSHPQSNIASFSILSDDRSKASSKTIPPHSAI